MARPKMRFQRNKALLASAGTHGIVLVSLALWSVAEETRSGRMLTMTRNAASEELVSLQLPTMDAPAAEVQDKAVAVDLPDPQVALPEKPVDPLMSAAPDVYAELTNPRLASQIGSGAISGQGDGTGQAFGGSGEGSGGGRGVTFFGTGMPAQRIVFVLDSSGSMKRPMYAQSREQVLKAEVMRAIRSLDEKMAFEVIFFNEDVLQLDAGGLKPANDENRRKMLRWVRAVIPTGHTWPGPALQIALKLEPDIIFFLTDGVFDAATVVEVTASNENQIPIFTIGLGDRRGAFVLTRLASQNGGLYRFVP